MMPRKDFLALTPEEQAREARFQERRLRTLRDPKFRRWLRESSEKAGIWEFAYGLDVGRRLLPARAGVMGYLLLGA